MKTSSPGPPPPLGSDRSKAWSYLITNLLVLPGLGSVMGRRKVGYVQMILAVAGFLVTVVAMFRITLLWTQEFMLPDDPALYWSGITGIAIFLLSWIWSLWTSLSLLRNR